MNTKTKREQEIERWFAVLAKRRDGLKWREIAAHFQCNADSLPRMAKKAENIERQKNGLPAIKPLKTRTFVICETNAFIASTKSIGTGEAAWNANADASNSLLILSEEEN